MYDIEFWPTGKHGNADGLSRLPLTTKPAAANPDGLSVFNVMQMDTLPVKSSEIMAATRTDPILSKVLYCLRHRWPERLPDSLIPFGRRREELTIEGDCILWGTRVVVPSKFRSAVLSELHHGHPGMVRMKGLALSYIWWPGIDKAVEECTRACSSCQANRHSPARAPLHPWAWPTVPWERVHVDISRGP